jgi:hypothetical protein
VRGAASWLLPEFRAAALGLGLGCIIDAPSEGGARVSTMTCQPGAAYWRVAGWPSLSWAGVEGPGPDSWIATAAARGRYVLLLMTAAVAAKIVERRLKGFAEMVEMGEMPPHSEEPAQIFFESFVR